MLNGGTLSACAIAGTAVFKMVVSKDSMKNPTATNQGSNRLAVAVSAMLSVAAKAYRRQAPASVPSTMVCASAISRRRCASL
jgi:hypothetical protein